ncbi:MAG: hypothetical protein AAF297_07785 [Planctomycetota bacterium]
MATPPRQPDPVGSTPDPVAPYREAVARFGPKFEALLWNKPAAQLARFDAIIEAVRTKGAVIADIGCGLADLANRLDEHAAGHAGYIGVDALPELLTEAAERTSANVGTAPRSFVEADFATAPDLFHRLVADHGANTFTFSGSLNTFDPAAATAVLDRAWTAAATVPAGQLAFNFLSTRHHGKATNNTGPAHRFDPVALLTWALDRTPLVTFRQDYLAGHDALITMTTA